MYTCEARDSPLWVMCPPIRPVTVAAPDRVPIVTARAWILRSRLQWDGVTWTRGQDFTHNPHARTCPGEPGSVSRGVCLEEAAGGQALVGDLQVDSLTAVLEPSRTIAPHPHPAPCPLPAYCPWKTLVKL